MTKIRVNGEINNSLTDKFNQSRTQSGRFSSFRDKLDRFMFRLGFAVFMLPLLYVTFQAGSHFKTKTVLAYTERSVDVTHAKLADLQMDVVDRLATQCESKGAKDPDGLIVFDTNKVASIGAWQFQVKTVKHYSKSLYGKTISDREAIQIATDHEKARQLAHDIIFKTDNGVDNWLNCSRKLQLAPEIAVLKKLAK